MDCMVIKSIGSNNVSIMKVKINFGLFKVTVTSAKRSYGKQHTFVKGDMVIICQDHKEEWWCTIN